MRIAMVSEHASPLATLGGVDIGGQHVHVAALAEHLGRRGHVVVVLTRRDRPELPSRVETDYYTVEHVAAGPARSLPEDELWPYMGDFADGLVPRLLAGQFDLVHSHFWMSGWATLRALDAHSELANLPAVHTFHALGVEKRCYEGAADTSPADRLEAERVLGRRMDAVLSTSRAEVTLLGGQGVDEAKCEVIPCGVDTELFTPRDEERPVHHAPPGHRYRILTLGPLVERKGVADVVAALPDVPDTELVVAGGPEHDDLDHDPQVQRLRELASATGVAERVRFTGSLAHDQVPRLVRSCDVVVSVPWYEPFGLVPLEAMACGRPVVGSAVGGLRDTVVPGDTGELVPPRDPAKLARTLAAMLPDEQRRLRYGEAGVNRVLERFTWPRVVAATERCYRDVCQEVREYGVRRRTRVLL